MSKNAVMIQVQTNNGNFINVMPGARILNTVAMMFAALMVDTWSNHRLARRQA